MFFIASQDAMSSSNELPAPQRYSSPRSSRFLLNLSSFKDAAQKGWCWQQIATKSPVIFLKHTYINTFYTNTLGISKIHQQYWNEYSAFMCHTIICIFFHTIFTKLFFVHNLKDLVPQIAPHFSPPFLLPLPKEQVSHFLIQLFTALVTRNLFLPLGGRVGRFLVVFFCGCDFFPTFFNAGLEDSSKKTSW